MKTELTLTEIRNKRKALTNDISAYVKRLISEFERETSIPIKSVVFVRNACGEIEKPHVELDLEI